MSVPLVHRDRCLVLGWLFACAFLVLCMVFVGGYTRLSGSGLSIVEWAPIHGVVPPLNEVEWQEEFDAYRATPQYQKINAGMSLDEFKVIFWPEFWHRILGRVVGLVFLLPLVVFTLRRSISRPFAKRMLGITALVGVQGFIGWVMVASGLKDHPFVSHFKLALHLSVAFAIFALILWAIGDVCSEPRSNPSPAKQKISISKHYDYWLIALIAQIVLGALVAGLHAGLVYNTWPDMNGEFLPASMLSLDLNQVLHDPAVVQFLHRTLAILVVAGFVFWWYLHRNYVKTLGLFWLCLVAVGVMGVQFALGVLTLLHMVPLPLALAHQMVALLLWAVAIVIRYQLVKAPTGA
jgi:heme a synthase